MVTATESGLKLVPDCKLLGWGKMRLFQRKGDAIAELGRGLGTLNVVQKRGLGCWAETGLKVDMSRGATCDGAPCGRGWAG